MLGGGPAGSPRPPRRPRRGPRWCSSTSARSSAGSSTSSRRRRRWSTRRRSTASTGEGRELIARVRGAPACACSRASRSGRRRGRRELLALGDGARLRAAPAAARARDRRLRARRAASRLDAAGLHDDRRRADADARLRVLPGRRVLVSGNGPLNIQVAAEIVRAGGEVVALCELAPVRARARAGAARDGAAAPGADARRARAWLASCARARVPLLTGTRSSAPRATARSSAPSSRGIDAAGRPVAGSERTFEVDAVCAGFGFLPSNELARTLGVAHRFDARLGQLAAVVDDARPHLARRRLGRRRRRRHRRGARSRGRSGCSPASTPRGASGRDVAALGARSGRRGASATGAAGSSAALEAALRRAAARRPAGRRRRRSSAAARR